ncbi:MinD/ParA family protein [Moorella sulfitireducens (nom. illeg.)]|uniref:MinD/ParA family protein n=1 Tax=Neomoorella sulfitireducens TaxID=2972948 RepID=UPI0021AC6D89|nr:MinD/ParA family protein [Moorella sulfitireducens]
MRKLVAGRAEGRSRVVAIASGKGGVGKTNIAVNLGLILARQGRRTLLFDADLGLANVDILMGLVPRYSLKEVAGGQCTIEEVVVHGPHDLLLVPGASGFQELAELAPGDRERLLQGLATLAGQVDIILVDSGAGISRAVFTFAAAAGEALVVATPEPTSITDAYGLIKGLQRLGVKMHLLINRAASNLEGQEAAGRLQGACRRFLHLELPLLGIIPEDPRVGQAVRRQQPFSELYPRCPATLALEEAAARFQGGELPAGRGQGFWQRLGRLLGR